MERVSHVLEAKGYEVFAVNKADTVFSALRIMAERDCGALLVMEGDALVGMISERDYARRVILLGKSSRSTTVAEIMEPKVLYVRPEQPVQDCMALMTEKKVRHLPVMYEGKVIGVISIGDVVKAIISEKQYRIEQLENYIAFA